MRQLYYTFRTLLRGRGGNLTKIISLTLGLLVGILLFARVAFELNYDSYYQEPENLFLTLRTVVSQGEKKEPVCSNYGKLPAAIRENFPDEVEDATLIDLFSRSSLYHEGQERKMQYWLLPEAIFFPLWALKYFPEMCLNWIIWMHCLYPVLLLKVFLQMPILLERQ